MNLMRFQGLTRVYIAPESQVCTPLGAWMSRVATYPLSSLTSLLHLPQARRLESTRRPRELLLRHIIVCTLVSHSVNATTRVCYDAIPTYPRSVTLAQSHMAPVHLVLLHKGSDLFHVS